MKPGIENSSKSEVIGRCGGDGKLDRYVYVSLHNYIVLLTVLDHVVIFCITYSVGDFITVRMVLTHLTQQFK